MLCSNCVVNYIEISNTRFLHIVINIDLEIIPIHTNPNTMLIIIINTLIKVSSNMNSYIKCSYFLDISQNVINNKNNKIQ